MVPADVGAGRGKPVVRPGRPISVGPEVRAPGKPRRCHRAPGRIVIEVRVAVDLILDQPLHGPGDVMVPRLDRTAGAREGAPLAALGVHIAFGRVVDDLDVRVAGSDRVDHLLPRLLRHFGISGKTEEVRGRRRARRVPRH